MESQFAAIFENFNSYRELKLSKIAFYCEFMIPFENIWTNSSKIAIHRKLFVFRARMHLG